MHCPVWTRTRSDINITSTSPHLQVVVCFAPLFRDSSTIYNAFSRHLQLFLHHASTILFLGFMSTLHNISISSVLCITKTTQLRNLPAAFNIVIISAQWTLWWMNLITRAFVTSIVIVANKFQLIYSEIQWISWSKFPEMWSLNSGSKFLTQQFSYFLDPELSSQFIGTKLKSVWISAGQHCHC